MQIINYIQDVKFVLWGIGSLGKVFFDSLDEGTVIAIIESNTQLIGTKYKNIEIISIETYLEKYSGYYIIVTPLYDKEIIEQIETKGIEKYFRLLECPMEVCPFDGIGFRENFHTPNSGDGIVGIYGYNLYAIALLKYWKSRGFKNIKLVVEDNNPLSVKESVIRDFKLGSDVVDIKDLDKNDVIYYAMYDSLEINLLREKVCCDIVELYDSYQYDIKKRIPHLVEFKDKHKGERCFIVATGPSLEMEDLDTLNKNNEICISMNNIMPAFKHTMWRPDYYMIADRSAIREWEEKIEDAPISVKFVSGYSESFWSKTRNQSIYKYNCNYNRSDREPPKFSIDICESIYLGWTITYACMQMAVYMGFKEIVLLGVDFSAGKQEDIGTMHFTSDYYEQGSTVTVSGYQTDRARVLAGYQNAERVTKQLGVKVYNATRGGNLDVFERVDFDKLF